MTNSKVTMKQPRTRRPFIIEFRSSRRIARQKDIASIWGSVDIAAVSQIVNRELSGPYTDTGAHRCPPYQPGHFPIVEMSGTDGLAPSRYRSE